MQTSPLRACVWQEMALGSNCHEPSQETDKSDQVALDGCISHPAEETHQCVCERPKVSADRSGACPMGVDLLPAAQPVLLWVFQPVLHGLNLISHPLSEPCPVARILPLLN